MAPRTDGKTVVPRAVQKVDQMDSQLADSMVDCSVAPRVVQKAAQKAVPKAFHSAMHLAARMDGKMVVPRAALMVDQMDRQLAHSTVPYLVGSWVVLTAVPRAVQLVDH